MADTPDLHTNRLINEKSPYLLQHAHNPVDWYPWGNEAFDKAAKEDKPIFLSIGYSACHWCHVMEKESFSDPEIARILNEHFVPIKVDREERPDIDAAYMHALVAMTGSGGWPLNIFMTPDKKPFYGGTYFPPEDRWGRQGLKTTLLSIAEVWKNYRQDVVEKAVVGFGVVRERGAVQEKIGRGGYPLDETALENAYEELSSHVDPRYGGFSEAPKFPTPHTISFLLRYWKRTGNPRSLEMAERTLSEMAHGGIRDHLGGGFHRYSTDALWRIPHFEKMLYDQALIARAYLEAYQATGKGEYAQAAREIFDYVLRDMRGREGGFFCGLDADSAPDGRYPEKREEGAFYLWRQDEIKKIFGDENAAIVNYYFGVEPSGNAVSDPTGEWEGKNVLYIFHGAEETARRFHKDVSEVRRFVEAAKEKLSSVRSERLAPRLDDKILVDWNGLMISSLAYGSRVLGEARYREAAEQAAQFIVKNLVDKSGRLLHRYRDGEGAIRGMIDDYAFFVHGLIDLYEATLEFRYLDSAVDLSQKMIDLFWDNESGGFYFTASDAEKQALGRIKEIYDGDIPSGNSIAALDLLRLGRFTMDEEFEQRAAALFKAFSGEVFSLPSGHAQTLIALDFALGPSTEIALAGNKDDPEFIGMLRSIYARFMPSKVVAYRPVSDDELEEVCRRIPFLKDQPPLGGSPTAYVCAHYTCSLPVTRAEELSAILDGEQGR